MTELYIDGVAAVLGKDFNIQVKRENPLFTKNGEYTYDITLPLDNATNAELYSHLNRLNSTQAVGTDRRAVLVADNRVYCNGTEVITGWTEDTVSIQIASGNSELNWFIGADLQISFLDMKQTIVPATESGKLEHIQKTYPDVDYCLAPVVNLANNYIFNDWDIKEGQEIPIEKADNTYIPQPFLIPYINDVLKALGYTLTENALENTEYKNLYICHGLNTDKWNELFPNWSVKDFLEQIEYLFNMTFVVNNKNRTVALIFNNRFWDGSHTVHISPVEDAYETEIDEEPDQEDMADSNVSYNLNDNEFWKTACLDDVVKESAKYEHIPADYTVSASQGDRISAWFNEDGGANRRIDTIWIDDLDGRQYLYIQLEDVNGDGRPDSHIELVDDFANLEREDSAPDVELKVSPATLTSVSKLRVPGEGNTPDRTPTNFLLPAVNEGTDIDETTDTETSGIISLGDLIYNGEPAKDTNSTLTLAFYTGMYRITIGGSHHYYPIAYIDDHRMLELLESLKDRAEVVEGTGIANHTLRLATLDKLFYQSTYDIDYKHAIKLTSHDPNLYDVRSIFEIRNKRYVCREMEFTLDANGRKGAWTGTFYPIRISDTEADARWILTDGRWRDGGVWLDNGRWLDDPT